MIAFDCLHYAIKMNPTTGIKIYIESSYSYLIISFLPFSNRTPMQLQELNLGVIQKLVDGRCQQSN